MSHVTHEPVTSYMNESHHIRISHITTYDQTISQHSVNESHLVTISNHVCSHVAAFIHCVNESRLITMNESRLVARYRSR